MIMARVKIKINRNGTPYSLLGSWANLILALIGGIVLFVVFCFFIVIFFHLVILALFIGCIAYLYYSIKNHVLPKKSSSSQSHSEQTHPFASEEDLKKGPKKKGQTYEHDEISK